MSTPRRTSRIAPLLGTLILSAAVLPLLGAGEDAPTGRQYALLVGVKNYNKDELRNLDYTENDVNDLAEVLKGAAYKRVVVLTQSAAADQRDNALLPTAQNIRDQLRGLLEDRKPGDSVLVAFSGHGVQPRGDKASSFCPMDARVSDPKTLISLGDVYQALEQCKADARVLLVDACRNDPLAGAAKGAETPKLESVTRPPAETPPVGVAALFSCAEGEQSYESARNKHGIFFHLVIEGLKGAAPRNKQGEVTLEYLAGYLKDEAPDAAKDEWGPLARQHPELVGKLSGSGVLAARTAARPLPLDCTGEKGVSAADVRKAQEAWAKYLGRKVEEEDEIATGVKMKFVLVPPGKFMMGSPKDEKDRHDDEVQHEVEITKPLYLGVYDVTQGQYEAGTGWTPSYFKGADLPVEEVSWDQADVFAKGLTEKAKDGLVYRLPTEAEWEYSCRGGHPSSQPFGIGDGTSLSSRDANFDGNYPSGGADKGADLQKTTPVGAYKPNAVGLYDMQGNVWQWCGDRYGDYPTGRVVNPEGPGIGSSRVRRGGSLGISASDCRAAIRNGDAPDFHNLNVGFRLARVPSGLSK